MSLLSRKVDYALIVLSYLHYHPEGECARAIADQFGLSRAFVANILKRLCCRGFVVSRRGIKGGYVLQKPAEKIYLTEIMDALEEGFQLAECCRDLPDESCVIFGICPIKGPVMEIHRRIGEMLSKVTLADLVSSSSGMTVNLETSRCQ